jgi:tetratricopeptide (TPR) repeat protein
MAWRLGAIALSLTIVTSNTAQAAKSVSGNKAADIKVARAADEAHDRDVDKVALASQEQAISKLKTLLKKYAGKRQEPVLLSKLAELQQQHASILFRIAHGSAHKGKKSIDLNRYNTSMQASIATINTLIEKYPYFEEIHTAYFMRGKGNEELGKVQLATKDYLHLVKNFPEVEEAIPAYMSLAEFSITAADHPKAITYLKEVEKKPESPHYPFALYKLSWSHYNLKNIPTALSYSERHVAYYNEKNTKSAELGVPSDPSDTALRDNTLSDITVFYIEGLEQKLPQYQLGEALPYFRKLESGPPLGRMLTKFAKLLRSHGHEQLTIEWKSEVLRSEHKRPESLDVVLTAYDFQLNKRRFKQLTETAQDIVRLHDQHAGYEGFKRAQKMLLDTAEGLQAVIVKNKNADDVSSLSPVLATIYESFTKIIDDEDPRISRVHYNLAETLFTIKDYQGASAHYRWVVDHGSWDKKKKDAGTVVDSSLKAIAARYEVLRQKQMVPKELTAKAITAESSKNLDPLVSEWIDWLDRHVSYSQEGTENFVFEANRTLYAGGKIASALKRLKKFSETYPKSAYAIPSASLAIDTHIASTDWEGTHELAKDFLDVHEWKSTPFAKHLYAVAADASYKMIEELHRKSDYKGTMKAADEFLKKYPTSKRLADTLAIAGSAAMAADEKPKASEYFTRLIKDVPKADSVGTALLARAAISEERYQFASAANDYRSYLGLPPSLIKLKSSEIDKLRRKTLAITWLSSNSQELRAAVDSKGICGEDLVLDCEKYQILMMISDSSKTSDQKFTERAFDEARKGNQENRTLWAIAALEGSQNLAWRDRLHMLKQIGTGWEDLDPLVRYTMIPIVSASIPRAFQLNRKMMREIAPLRANERYITHRIDVVREIENSATKAMKLPWSKIRSEVLSEVAGLYLDVARELSLLSPPKGLEGEELAAYQDTVRKLVMPFEEKGQEIRGKAFDIASRFSIDDRSFDLVAEPFFAENPSLAKSLKPAMKLPEPPQFDFALLDNLDPSGDWDDVSDGDYRDSKDKSLYLKQSWADAIKSKRWQQVGFFLQEAREKKLIKPSALGVVNAVSLAAVGARGEAIGELEAARKDFEEPKFRSRIQISLLQYAVRSFSKKRAEELIKDINPEDLTGKDAALVADASIYTGIVKPTPTSAPEALRAPASAPTKKRQ